MVEHGYTTSPLLVDGKLVIYLDSFVVLDPETGSVVLEQPRFIPKGMTFQQTAFYGAGCVLSAGGEKVVYYPKGEFVRLSDGKTLACDPKLLQVQNNIITPLSERGITYTILHNPEQTYEGGEYAVGVPRACAAGGPGEPRDRLQSSTEDGQRSLLLQTPTSALRRWSTMACSIQ